MQHQTNLPIDPLQGPHGLLAHARDSVNGVEQLVLLNRILDVSLQQQRVHLTVNVLNGNLEAIEGTRLHETQHAPRRVGSAQHSSTPTCMHMNMHAGTAAHLRLLHFAHEACAQVLIDDSIRGRKESKDTGDEEPLVVVELLPVLHVITQVDLLRCSQMQEHLRHCTGSLRGNDD